MERVAVLNVIFWPLCPINHVDSPRNVGIKPSDEVNSIHCVLKPDITTVNQVVQDDRPVPQVGDDDVGV